MHNNDNISQVFFTKKRAACDMIPSCKSQHHSLREVHRNHWHWETNRGKTSGFLIPFGQIFIVRIAYTFLFEISFRSVRSILYEETKSSFKEVSVSQDPQKRGTVPEKRISPFILEVEAMCSGFQVWSKHIFLVLTAMLE